MDSFAFIAHDPQDTARFGKALATAVSPGLVIALDGPLGAGKTTLVRAIAVGLGVNERTVASPTFVLIHQYQGKITIYHFDAYRIAGDDEFLSLGVDEYFEGQGLSLVEWADRVIACLPEDRLSIRIGISGEESRQFTVGASGTRSAAALDRLRYVLGSSQT